jgi:hypothetical protein
MQTPAQTPRNARRPALSRAQKGIVTSAAQVTLALVSLVVGGTALSLDEAREQVAEQTAHLHATYLLKASDALQTALDRAVVDSGLSRGRLASVVTLDAAPPGAGRIALFDADLGYGRKPRWPAGLLVEGVEGAGQPQWSQEAPQVMVVAGIDLAVCRRYNEMVQGARGDEAPPTDINAARRDLGWQQGCVAGVGADAGTWFMTAFATADCLGAFCRSGDAVGEAARRMVAGLETAPQAAPPAAEGEVDEAGESTDPVAALVECASRAAAAGERDPEMVAARCAEVA